MCVITLLREKFQLEILYYQVVSLQPQFFATVSSDSSALSDSYQDNLLAPPIYTRPASYKGWEVPPILTSGNTPAVELWREEQAFERTQKLRPDLLEE